MTRFQKSCQRPYSEARTACSLTNVSMVQHELTGIKVIQMYSSLTLFLPSSSRDKFTKRDSMRIYQTLPVEIRILLVWLHTCVVWLHTCGSSAYIVNYMLLKVILCESEHICSIVRYCFRSFKQLASSAGGPGFNPQSRTASSIA